ncbi:hypothetical protein HJG60_012034 [Phyllostomus discolor]|uniref:Uncharacterized protein n=1 Tax=Phyllostomus discolor TaxID=89673 RepID=A0A833ZLC1_9CHIR|nr:hypothetical protein HJG60_012034 [Phyllostomus discolor]
MSCHCSTPRNSSFVFCRFKIFLPSFSLSFPPPLPPFLFYYLFLEKGERRDPLKRRKHACVREISVASCMHPTCGLAHNPGMRSDWESTSDLSVCQRTPNPLSHTRQGLTFLVFAYVSHFVIS